MDGRQLKAGLPGISSTLMLDNSLVTRLANSRELLKQPQDCFESGLCQRQGQRWQNDSCVRPRDVPETPFPAALLSRRGRSRHQYSEVEDYSAPTAAIYMMHSQSTAVSC